MIDIHFDDIQFTKQLELLNKMGRHVTERDYDIFLRRALKPVKERMGQFAPKSINNSRGSYSSAQSQIEKYGLLEKALGISKRVSQNQIGEHSFFVGYSSTRGKKAFVSVFLNYGTKTGNRLKALGFAKAAERATLNEVKRIYKEEVQKKWDSVMSRVS
jgi:hypothetical protein